MARKNKTNRKYSSNRNGNREQTTRGPQISNSKDQQSATDDPKDVEKAEDKAKNDPEWYSRDPQLLLDAGSIPFSDVFGRELKAFEPGTVFTYGANKIGMDSTVKQQVIPGICVMDMFPSVGDARDRNSPVNVAATALYTHVRYVNSGRKNYDPADLMMYSLAIADLYSYIMWMMRIYNCAFIFSQRNLYIGKALLEAQRIDPSIIEDLAAFRYWINVFINKIASYAVPASIYLFQKRAFMYGSIYTESASGNIKDQLYLYNPYAFYKFQLDSQGKGMLAIESVRTGSGVGSTNTLADLMRYGDDLLSNMWGDEDFGLMSGDVLRAFGGDIVKVAPLSEEGGLLPVYDPMVLHQMKNSRIVNVYNISGGADPSTHDGFEIPLDPNNSQHVVPCCVYQDGYGNIQARYPVSAKPTSNATPTDMVDLANTLANVVIAIDAPEVNPAIIVEATRNIPVAKDFMEYTDSQGQPSGHWGLSLDTGDMLCVHARIYTNDPTSNGYTLFSLDSNFIYMQSGAAHLGENEMYARVAAMFRFAPTLYRFNGVLDPNIGWWNVTTCNVISDVWNYTVQKASVIARLHTLSMLSLLYVPGVAKQINYMK